MRTTHRSWAWATVLAVLLVASATGGGHAGAMSTVPGPPQFEASIEPIDGELATEMAGVSWHPGCPVALADLRLITMNHWNFDGDVVSGGELVVHAAVADDLVGVFEQLFDARFPIAKMQRIEHYAGDDDASMDANNTSAFNCREITGGGAWSIHSYGQAVDINPLENPYVRDGTVLPAAGSDFLDRSNVRPGMIVAGDVVVEAFAAIGFEWGGDWTRLKDYQHFEVPDPASGPAAARPVCERYEDNAGRYPIRLCDSGLAVTNVQTQLLRHGHTIAIDGYFGPETVAAVKAFQAEHDLEVDGLVGPLTWPVLLGDEAIGADVDGNGAIEPWEIAMPADAGGCSPPVPDSGAAHADGPNSDGWSGTVGGLIGPSGELDVAPFNEFLATAPPPINASPCDAARVLLHLDRLDQGETIDLVVDPEADANATVTVTIGGLLDDSVAAVRYVLRFEDHGDDTIRLAAGRWSQQCQPGRGHQDFTPDLCV